MEMINFIFYLDLNNYNNIINKSFLINNFLFHLFFSKYLYKKNFWFYFKIYFNKYLWLMLIIFIFMKY